LIELGADVNAKTPEGQTPTHIAAAQNNDEVNSFFSNLLIPLVTQVLDI
jgi:ankyrin repeat protein